jgi:hypothetical protein
MFLYTPEDNKIDIKDFPKVKHAFDLISGTTVTEESNQLIVMGFEIWSELILFQKIKISVWRSFLMEHNIFVKKYPGLLSKMDIIKLG